MDRRERNANNHDYVKKVVGVVGVVVSLLEFLPMNLCYSYTPLFFSVLFLHSENSLLRG